MSILVKYIHPCECERVMDDHGSSIAEGDNEK
jgi:hypothetical protein